MVSENTPRHFFNCYLSASRLYNVDYRPAQYFNSYLPVSTYYWNIEVFKYFIPVPLEYYDAYTLDEMSAQTLRKLSFREIT